MIGTILNTDVYIWNRQNKNVARLNCLDHEVFINSLPTSVKFNKENLAIGFSDGWLGIIDHETNKIKSEFI